MTDSIRVVCRLRSFNKIQMANNGQQCVQYDDKNIKINVGGDQNKYNFAFDKIFGPSCVQLDVYSEVAIPVIKSVVSGYNGTIFAYGQTGAGKTWTMQGPNHYDPQYKGLIPRTVDGLFDQIRQSDQNIQFVIKCSYVEIYNQKLFDLLDPSKARLQVKEDKIKGIFIQNCTQIPVGSSQQMLKVMNNGAQNRKVAFTGMNERSSRSHSLFIIHVSQKHIKKDSTKQSRLYFVDLAGSQKVGKTGVVGQQLQQAKNINKSLSALGNVINALTAQKKQHIPYRDSKLTRILQQSLGGNSKTTLVICCSMCSYNDKETLSTLRFGYRAKSIKNKAKINEQKSAKQLLILLQAANKTINQLKIQLKTGVISTPSTTLLPPAQQTQSEKQVMNDKLQSQIQQIQKLRQSLEQLQTQQYEKNKSLKQLQFRTKSLLLQLDKEKLNHEEHLKECSSIYKSFKQYMQSINKYLKRAVIDVQYFVNSALVSVTGGNSNSIKQQKQLNPIVNNNQQHHQQAHHSLSTFLKESQQYLIFYQQKLKPIFYSLQRQANYKDLDNFQIHSDKGNNNLQDIKNNHQFSQQSFKSQGQPTSYLNTQKRRIKIAQSQPQLFPQQFQTNKQKQDFQMSFIYQRPAQQSINNMTTSDKISQQQSFTQIQTLLQSLETKQSHKILLEELNGQLKMYKRDVEDLNGKIQKLKLQNKTIQKQLQQKYQQMIVDLEQRAQQYKNIIGKKDQQIQSYLKREEKIKKDLSQEKVVSERFKKIIQSNTSMKQYHQMEQRVRTLANQRQKLFNQMFKLREQLDQADLTIKEKEQHIESLKEVMKQLSQQTLVNSRLSGVKDDNIQNSQNIDDIEKRYNTKVYGTQVPNVIQPIRGGQSGRKMSTLRKKIPIDLKKQQKPHDNNKSGIGSYFKGIFG